MAKIALICMLFALVAIAQSASVPAEKSQPEFPDFLQKSLDAVKDSLNDENIEKLKKEAQDALDKAKKFGDDTNSFTQEQLSKFLDAVQKGAKSFQESLNKN